jgi:NADH:ubiquinone oxidoreductase subunit C
MRNRLEKINKSINCFKKKYFTWKIKATIKKLQITVNKLTTSCTGACQTQKEEGLFAHFRKTCTLNSKIETFFK